jgi:hypothetical protein
MSNPYLLFSSLFALLPLAFFYLKSHKNMKLLLGAPTKDSVCRGAPATQNDINYITAYAQFKRHGDHSQIYSAYGFPYWAESQPNRFVLKKRPNGAPPITIDHDTGSTDPAVRRRYFRQRTYFVTIDWPAFIYCILNSINCIFDFLKIFNTIDLT